MRGAIIGASVVGSTVRSGGPARRCGRTGASGKLCGLVAVPEPTMICSMTAFARREARSPLGTFTWEIRSVNQRFLEPSFRLPDSFRGLETALRDKLKTRLTRGKLDCSLRFEPSFDAAMPAINEDLVRQLSTLSARLKDLGVAGSSLSHADILRWPGVVQNAETDQAQLEAQALAAFDAALDELIAMRAREGDALRSVLIERLDGIDAEAEKARLLLPEVRERLREKLLARFEEMKVELDPQRLEQEMVLAAQRMDVDEELDRLRTHTSELRRLLDEGGAIGRKLDFLIQELHRESNTLGSKSASTQTTGVSVALKVLVEQMREQVQNIE